MATSAAPIAKTGKYGDLRRRLVFLLLALVVYRVGAHIPVPGIDPAQLQQLFSGQQGILNLFNMFSGGALSRFTVFALGIMPYISASIIMQLMTYAVPTFEQLKKEGKPLVPADGLISMAQELLPKLRVAEWLDKAEAAKADIDLLDLRDLRQVVVGADDPMVVRDETTRSLAAELKAALKTRQEFEQTRWLEDIKSALAVSRVIRALKISSEPPKAGQPFPADLGAQLATAASASLASETAPDRFSAVLEAIAFSPVRGQVKLAAAPPTTNEAMLSTVKRVAPLVPHIASVFGITVAPGANSPRPLRPTRPVRPKGKPAPAKRPQVTTAPAAAATPEAPAVTEAPSTSE